MKDTNTDFITLVKRVLLGLFLVLVIILLFKKCDCGRTTPTETVRVDTVYKEVKGEVVYVPKVDTMYFTKTTSKTIPYRVFDTLYLPELVELEPDTAAIIANYTKAFLYSDTIKNKYGNIIINDTLTRNRIYGRGVKTNLLIPEVTKTITLTQPRRNMVFIGANLLGSETDFFKGYNVNLSLKTKQDRMIEVGYNQLFGGEHYYSLGLKWKLSFTKK